MNIALTRCSLLCIWALAMSGCALNGPRAMLTATTSQESAIAFSQFAEVVPAPAFVVRTSAPTTLTVLLTAECRVARPGDVLEARITVDGRPTEPASMIMTTTERYEARSLMAVKANVGPGAHKVTVQWRASQGTGFIRRRSLTVWQLAQNVE